MKHLISFIIISFLLASYICANNINNIQTISEFKNKGINQEKLKKLEADAKNFETLSIPKRKENAKEMALKYYQIAEYYMQKKNYIKAIIYFKKEKERIEQYGGFPSFDFRPEVYIDFMKVALKYYNSNTNEIYKNFGRLSRFHDIYKVSGEMIVARYFQPGDYGPDIYDGFILFYQDGDEVKFIQKKLMDLNPRFTEMNVNKDEVEFISRYRGKIYKTFKFKITSGKIEQVENNK